MTQCLPVSRWGTIMGLSLVMLIVISNNAAFGQINRYIQQGNKFYQQQDYKAAANDYAKALSKDPTNVPSIFNFGNSMYQQKQYD